MESCPSEHEKEKVIRICRCWQSAKFPYCDDTHKVFIENGDNVGPYVAKLVSYKLSDEEKLKQQKYNEKYIKINNTLTSNKTSAVNMKFGYKPLVNYKPCLINKLKKSIFLSFVVLSSTKMRITMEDTPNQYRTLEMVNKQVRKNRNDTMLPTSCTLGE
ncbi:hypothetical protein, conserved [Plasmodium ovale curtisi]|uniref:Iron-binding zinc finger CDGSH type domain-containing protein n=1 Tax=Plasmodium ovale curtisi TaxID=864141 RepID=A0A1A8VV56_PLAOA|nr:hypothetical protein, conserved [Plasmodium ovale curtisi]SBS90159.1 hypothetical protein, conserved [Plasmodium ovale curtisi]